MTYKKDNQLGYSKENEELVRKFIQDLKDDHAKTTGLNLNDMFLSSNLRWVR